MSADAADPEAAYRAFLAGDRPEDVLVFLHEEAVGDPDALGGLATAVEEGLVAVLPGGEGRAAFERAVGLDPMDFAGTAMRTDGEVDRDCTGGVCPNDESGTHRVRFLFAFAEERNEAVGGLYAEGDVVHAYAACDCGTTYSDRWVASTGSTPTS